MPEPDDTITVITHGTHCPNWPYSQNMDDCSAEELLAAQLIKDDYEPDDWVIDPDSVSGVWRCPFCRQAVFIYSNDGEIDFGTMQPDLIKKNSVIIETFEPVAIPPTLTE